MISPIMLMRLSVCPNAHIMMNVPMNEIGKPMAAQNATRQFKNNTSDNSTKNSPDLPLRVIKSSRPSTNRAKSLCSPN